MITTASCLSSEEQATLKTALAFVVLRNRHSQRKRQKALPSEPESHSIVPPFCRNLLQITSLQNGTIPGSNLVTTSLSSICDKEHVEQMLKIALSAVATAPSIHVQRDAATAARRATVIDTNADYGDNARFSSVAAHMARQLLHSDLDWLLTWFSDRTLQYETRSICTLWHCMAQTKSLPSNEMPARLIQAVCRLLDNIYHDRVIVAVTDTNQNADADTLVVNLLLLLEAFLSMRLQAAIPSKQLLKELLDALDHNMTLFIPVKEMPAYLQANIASRNLSPSSRIMLHLALYDLIVKLTL